MNDSAPVELLVRDALHDAADRARLVESVPLTDAPARAPRRRTRVLVAACVVLVALAAAITAAVVSGNGDDDVHVTSPAPQPREVPAADLSHQDTDLEVFFATWATDAEIQTIRDVLSTSPDVAHFAYVDHDAAYREFAELFACNPDLVHSIRPQDLPLSFRVVGTSPDAVERLRTALAGLPGVDTVEEPETVAAPTTVCSTPAPATTEPEPTTVPPTRGGPRR